MIKYYNRNKKTYEIEKIAGEKYLDWIYSSPIGKGMLELIIKKKTFSKLYGTYCNTRYSCKKIKRFVKNLNIDMSKYKKSINEFKSFNDFFIRKLKKEYLNFSTSPLDLISPCDGRLLVYKNIKSLNNINVKDFNYSIEELLNNVEISSQYEGGTCLVFRLCPTDYHRFHFIDNGTCSNTTKIKGMYYSVNPVSLNSIKKVFLQNKREWSIFHSKNFKDIIYIEVGATCVGTIKQTYTPFNQIERGDEKGYFKFGGSTVILIFKKDCIKIHEDILFHSKKGIETLVSMGETIGNKFK